MLDTKTNIEEKKIDIDPKNLEVSFGDKPTETKDEETKPKAIKVSLGKDSEALAEEKAKPKEKQDKEKIKQLEKSIKDRKDEIKNQIKSNRKYKPGKNVWNDVIDDKNADDWSYIANEWLTKTSNLGAAVVHEDFYDAVKNKITNDNANDNTIKDREYYLNLSQKGFDEWNSNQENPDDPNNVEKYKKEVETWENNVKKAQKKYGGKKGYYTVSDLYDAYFKARKVGDYDAAAILLQASYNVLDKEKTEKIESAWEKYNSASGSASGLFNTFKTYGIGANKAKEEFLRKQPNPSEAAKKAFRDIYGEDLIVEEIKTETPKTEEIKTETPKTEEIKTKTPKTEEIKTETPKTEEIKTETPKTEDFKVGSNQRKTLNEAQSETAKNIKDLVLDEAYQTLTDNEKREALKKATEKALNKYSANFIEKAKTREDAAQLSKFLPRFAIQHFIEGNFGDKKKAGSWGTLGYFLLDKVGKSLVNASQVARGLSPSEKTALESYNETMMKNAFGRDDENRKRILNSSLDTLVKDSDVLREVGISDFKIFDDFTEKVLTQYQDNIQNVNLDKILKEKSDFILNMPSEEQQKFIGYLIAMGVSESGSAAYLNAAYRAADMEQRFAKTDAEKYAAQKSKTEINLKLAGMEVNNKTLFAQLDSIELKNEKDRATMAAEIDRVVRENEKLIEDIKKARTENSYLAKEKEKELEQKVANIVSTYANVGANSANTVSKIIDAIIPG